MSTVHAHDSSGYEKSLAVALVVGIAVAGWTPAMAAMWDLPYGTKLLWPASLAMTLFALGLVHDAAERLLGVGRGIYAAAVFCSLPATGLIASNPARLAIGALTMVTALSLWLASRATGEERPFFFGMLTFLSLVAWYLYGVAALPTLFGFVLAGRTARRVTAATLLLPLVACILGFLAHKTLTFGLPLPKLHVDSPEPWTAVLLPWLPWGFLIPCAISQSIKRRAASRWWLAAAVAAVLMILLAAFGVVSFATAAAVTAPVLALLAADIIIAHFLSTPLPGPSASRLPIVNAAAILFVLAAAALNLHHAPLLRAWDVVAGALLAGALVWLVIDGFPRWNFAALFAAGMLFGYWAAQREPLFPEADNAVVTAVPLPFLALALLTAGGFYLTLHLALRKSRREWVPDYVYGGENFHRFAGGSSTPATVSGQLGQSYRFAIFGDAAGAEADSATRHSGAAAFSALADRLTTTGPAFAISLGDLARQATAGAYRRAQLLLAQIPVPLAVTPGNHDLFAYSRWNAAHFHALCGADNFAFTLGPVKYIVLNNAWGSINDQQFVWLETQLAEHPAPFTLLFCHKPPFDPRMDAFYGMEERPHAERLHALCRDHHVQAVFSGHIHTLLTETRDGVCYVISGGGGSKLAAGGRYHYLEVDVSETAVTIRALPLDGDATSVPLAVFHLTPRL